MRNERWTPFLFVLLLLAMLISSAPAVTAEEDDDDGRDGSRASGQNYAVVLNTRDERVSFDVSVSVDFLRNSAEGVIPQNWACGSNGGFDPCWPSCSYLPIQGCIDAAPPPVDRRTSISVALQLALYEGAYRGGTPFNFAIAKNENCNGCQVFANATQSLFPVEFDDVDRKEVEKGLKEIEKQLESIGSRLKQDSITFESALLQIDETIGRFCQLAASLGGGCTTQARDIE